MRPAAPPPFERRIRTVSKNTEGPEYAFSEEGRNLSVRCGFQTKTKSKPNPGAGTNRLPLVGPEPRQKNASGGPRSAHRPR